MIDIDRSPRWYRNADVLLILVVLLAIGALHYSTLTAEQRREIELKARLEQVHEFEMDYYTRHKRYFDPRAAQYRSYLGWLQDCDCDVRLGRGGVDFSVVARADFDGDGQAGVWRIDETSPMAVLLVKD